MELKLPAPCVVVLVGPSRAGKTTWAQAHFASNEVVSSDALRGMVGIDEDDQTASAAAFALLEQIVAERISRGLTTVVDTTGLHADNRLKWITTAHEAGVPIYAILFTSTLAEIELRNDVRARPIPRGVLRKQFANMKKTLEGIADEGFDGVHREQTARTVVPKMIAPISETRQPADHTFGLLLSRFEWAGPDLGGQLESIAKRAEEAGFTDLWLMDHFRQIHQVGRPWEDIPEAYTTLSYLAGVTSRIRLGVLVSGITHRNPVVLGKMLATLDVLSSGRVIAGLGAAWDEQEHGAFGLEFPELSHRYDVLGDTLQMLPLLWGKGTPSFQGKTFSATELISYPRPIQNTIPIMVGGSGEQKTLRLVAEYADACNLFGDPDTIRHKVEVLHRHCFDIGRDPESITVTHLITTLAASNPTTLRDRISTIRGRNQTVEDYAAKNHAGTTDDLVSMFHAYSDAGADHSIVALPDVAMDESIETFAEVIARFRVS